MERSGKRQVCYPHRSSRQKAWHATQGHKRQHLGNRREQGDGIGQSYYRGFHRKHKVGQGEQFRTG